MHGLLKGCRNIQIDTYDKEGNTLLHMAVRSGNLQITEYLVEAGASINAQDVYTYYIFMYINIYRKKGTLQHIMQMD